MKYRHNHIMIIFNIDQGEMQALHYSYTLTAVFYMLVNRKQEEREWQAEESKMTTTSTRSTSTESKYYNNYLICSAHSPIY